MASSTAIVATLTLMLFLTSASSGHQLGWFPAIETSSRSATDTVCKGTVGECIAGDVEYFDEVDSESTRRMLAMRRYISYGALRRNIVPCSRRGASYYNCRRGAPANPYSRGCSAITRCRH